jgi:hypothetical protein
MLTCTSAAAAMSAWVHLDKTHSSTLLPAAGLLQHLVVFCPALPVLYMLQYAHMDFVWDRNARHAVDLVDLLYRYAPQ